MTTPSYSAKGTMQPARQADFLKVIFIAQAKFPAKRNCAWKCARNDVKHRKSALKSVKSGYIGNFVSSAFKSQNFAQVVDNFAQTCVCVSATFRNSVGRVTTEDGWKSWATIPFFQKPSQPILSILRIPTALLATWSCLYFQSWIIRFKTIPDHISCTCCQVLNNFWPSANF